MSRWLTIVGMGEDGWEGLGMRAREAVTEAEVVIGSQRLLGFLPSGPAERVEWPQPFNLMADRIAGYRGRRTIVLATGDPMNYGVARKLLDLVPLAETEIIPHLSAFSLVAARMGWSLPDCETLSLHGRPAAQIEAFIQPQARLIVLTADASTIPEVARRLVARGFEDSEITVLENLGGPRERQSCFVARECPSTRFSDLNTLAIKCLAKPGALFLPPGPGLPDEAYVHDGQITKREVRAMTLAALGPVRHALLWDVGAGCGSIAIEWLRAARGARAIAFERDQGRLKMIAENMDRLGAPLLVTVAGQAPASLAYQPAPDAVFIGGGLGDPGVFETAWAALKPGGRMVVNVVTLEGELHLIDLQAAHGGGLVRVEISHLAPIGALRALKPRMPVLQWRAVKP